MSGIWQTVWLEPVNPVHIASFTMEPNLDKKWLSLMVNPSEPEGVTVNAKIKDKEGNVVSTLENGNPAGIIRMTIDGEVHPWSVEDPYLYDLEISLLKNGKETDAVKSYCGIRKIEVKKVGDIPRIFLNDKQIFQMGPLDQGWWPDGLYTAPSDEALLFDIRTMKRIGDSIWCVNISRPSQLVGIIIAIKREFWFGRTCRVRICPKVMKILQKQILSRNRNLS